MSRASRLSKRSIASRPSRHTLNIDVTEDSSYDVLPKISDEKWIEIIKMAEEDRAYCQIMHEIYRKAREEEKNEYIKMHVYPFTVMCAHIAWSKIINIYFQRYDPGEPAEKYEAVWKADDEPVPSPVDSWLSHNVPLLENPIPEDFKTSSKMSHSKRKPVHVDKKELIDGKTASVKTRDKELKKNIFDDHETIKKSESVMSSVDLIHVSVIDKSLESHSTADTPAVSENIHADDVQELENASDLSKEHENVKDSAEKIVDKSQSSKTVTTKRRHFLISELEDDMKDLLKILFGDVEYERILKEKRPVPLDLIDFAIESLPTLDVPDDLTSEVIRYFDDFDEEDEFGFCFTEEEDYSINDILRESMMSSEETDQEDSQVEVKIYQKYESDPIIFDQRSSTKAKVKALTKQNVLFSSNTLNRAPEQ